jgi:hypothetical protein
MTKLSNGIACFLASRASPRSAGRCRHGAVRRPCRAGLSSCLALFGARVDRRRILRIDQHQIGAGSLNPRDAFLDQFGGFGGDRGCAARRWCRPARSPCPDACRARRSATASSFRAASFAPLAGVDHRNVGGRILPAQLRRQPVRIGEVRRRRAMALASTKNRTRRSPPARRRRVRSPPRQRAHLPDAALRRQAGHRLKMSPADFATSLTFSIALVVRLFCDGLAGSPAATLPPAAPRAAALPRRIWRHREWLLAGCTSAPRGRIAAAPAARMPRPRARPAIAIRQKGR